jgi:hypothetical protein
VPPRPVTLVPSRPPILCLHFGVNRLKGNGQRRKDEPAEREGGDKKKMDKDDHQYEQACMDTKSKIKITPAAMLTCPCCRGIPKAPFDPTPQQREEIYDALCLYHLLPQNAVFVIFPLAEYGAGHRCKAKLRIGPCRQCMSRHTTYNRCIQQYRGQCEARSTHQRPAALLRASFSRRRCSRIASSR